MMNFYKSLVIVLCFGIFASCDKEEDREESAATPAQTQQLQSTVSDLGNVGQVQDQTTASNANGTLMGMYSNYDSLVQGVFMQDAAQAPVPRAPDQTVDCGTGSYVWAAGSVTYNACDGLNGTVTWTGTDYVFDLTYDFAAAGIAGYTGQFSYNGSLSVTETLINGNLNMAYQFTYDMGGQQLSYDSSYAILYDNIGLDPAGCPVSGALDLDGSWSYNAAGQAFDETFNITFQFNACNDVTVLY